MVFSVIYSLTISDVAQPILKLSLYWLFCKFILTGQFECLARKCTEKFAVGSDTERLLPGFKIRCVKKNPRWAYNPKSQQCEKFLYRGPGEPDYHALCAHNNNFFREKRFCEKNCSPFLTFSGRRGPHFVIQQASRKTVKLKSI